MDFSHAPPAYDSVDSNSSFNDFSQWSEEQVADAVGKMGLSKAWKRYSTLCLEEELDGMTMKSITIEDLEKYKFKTVHARAVVNYFQSKTTPFPQKKHVMGLTEKEMKIMAPLVDQVEKCRQSCVKLEQVMVTLQTQKDEKLAQVDKWFQHAHTVLKQSHASITEEINNKFTEAHTLNTQYLEIARQVQQNITDTERKCLSFPAETLLDIKARTDKIKSLVDQCLAVAIPSRAHNFQLSVSFAPALVPFFAAVDRSELVIVNLRRSQFRSQRLVEPVGRTGWSNLKKKRNNSIMGWVGSRSRTPRSSKPLEMINKGSVRKNKST